MILAAAPLRGHRSKIDSQVVFGLSCQPSLTQTLRCLVTSAGRHLHSKAPLRLTENGMWDPCSESGHFTLYNVTKQLLIMSTARWKTTAGSHISICYNFLNHCVHQKITTRRQRFKLPFGLLFSHQLQPIAPALNGKLMHATAHENNSLDGPSEQWMAFSQLRVGDYFA